MASSGSVVTNTLKNSYYYLDWQVSSQNISSNYTDINWQAGIVANSNHWYSNAMKINEIWINGILVFSGGTYSNLQGGSRELTSGTARIYHDTDGSKSFGASISGWLYSYGNCYGESSWSLDTIPRASTPSVSGTLELGGEITITTNRASSSFTHCLYYHWKNLSWQHFASDVGSSKTWTIPKTLANYIPNGTSETLFIVCETYNGDTYIGAQTISMTVTVPNTSEFQPSISSIDLSEAISAINTQFGAYIQNQSKLKCIITAAEAYSSSIKSYKVVVNGTIYYSSSFTTDFLKLSGTNSVVVTVTDTRGRSVTSTQTFEVLAYKKPTITKIVGNRCLEDGTLNDEGEFTKIEITATIQSLNDENTYSYYLQYKDINDDEYTQYSITLTETKTDTIITISGSTIIAADENSSFDYMFGVTDYFSSDNRVINIDTIFQLINFNTSGKGIALGKVSEKDAFEVKMDVEIEGDLKVNGNNLYDIIVRKSQEPVGEFVLWEGNNYFIEDGEYHLIGIMYSPINHLLVQFPYIVGFTRKYKLMVDYVNTNANSVYLKITSYSSESLLKEYLLPNVWGDPSDHARYHYVSDFDVFEESHLGTEHIKFFVTPSFGSGACIRIKRISLLVYDVLE